jgi:hypothetical protein
VCVCVCVRVCVCVSLIGPAAVQAETWRRKLILLSTATAAATINAVVDCDFERFN